MGRTSNTATAATLLAFGLAFSLAGPALTQTVTHDIPQAVRLSHEETLRELTALGQRHSRVGEIARKALPVFKAHFRREDEYILPPLTLAPALARGQASADMRWAIAMADRIRADAEMIFQEHTVITQWMIELEAAAERSHDRGALEFAQAAVADSLYDTEITEPTAILIGEYLRAKLPPAQ